MVQYFTLYQKTKPTAFGNISIAINNIITRDLGFNDYIAEIHFTAYCSNESDPDHITIVFDDGSRLQYNLNKLGCQTINSQCKWSNKDPCNNTNTNCLALQAKNEYLDILNDIIETIKTTQSFQQIVCKDGGKSKKSKKSYKNKKSKKKYLK